MAISHPAPMLFPTPARTVSTTKTALMMKRLSLESEPKPMMGLTNNLAIEAAPNAAGNLMQLEEEHKNETLAFLSTRILHTFVMTGWLHDNGVVNPLNRGTFYGYRNHTGQLDGVALIGHTTLFEARSDEAVAAFAGLTQECSAASALM